MSMEKTAPGQGAERIAVSAATGTSPRQGRHADEKGVDLHAPVKPKVADPAGRDAVTGSRSVKDLGAAGGLALPHERDEGTCVTAEEPDPVMVQAKRDIDAGMVDTDMRATPGLDAELRARLVPGPAGKSPPSRR